MASRRRLAHASGLPASSYAFPELSAHLLPVTPTHRRLEHLDYTGRILGEPVRIQGGYATASDGPGSGVE